MLELKIFYWKQTLGSLSHSHGKLVGLGSANCWICSVYRRLLEANWSVVTVWTSSCVHYRNAFVSRGSVGQKSGLHHGCSGVACQGQRKIYQRRRDFALLPKTSSHTFVYFQHGLLGKHGSVQSCVKSRRRESLGVPLFALLNIRSLIRYQILSFSGLQEQTASPCPYVTPDGSSPPPKPMPCKILCVYAT